MAASDDFKQQIRDGNLSDALKLALSEAIHLEITTWVSSPEQGDRTAMPGSRMRTRINVVDGDIENEIGSQFLEQGPYQELRDFHLGWVQESRAILQENLESLQEIFGTLTYSLQQLQRAEENRPLLEPQAQNGALPATPIADPINGWNS